MSVNGGASFLYNELGGADAALTAAQSAGVAKLARDYPAVAGVWSKLKSADLAALNRELKSAGMSEIHLTLNAPPKDDSDDSDDVG